MPKYKLKKGIKLGALSAESDLLLEKVFVDTGYLECFLDTDSPNFLILGRTGSGKTALIEGLKKVASKTSTLDPEELSMQYLHSNSILKLIADWGIHLDIFFKYLWRHICIMELIKLRYEDGKKAKLNLFKILYGDAKKTEQIALDYLEKHGEEYWITADTHVKNFTKELISKISSDQKIKGKIDTSMFDVSGQMGNTSSNVQKEGIEVEVIARTQAIVNDYQIAALNEVIKRLSDHSFNDSQKKYYIVIDDLDKNWMPNDIFYLTLIKSLLYTVREINQKLQGVKIIVALRTNIFYRVFRKSNEAEPQREKWADVLQDIKWKKEELIVLVNKRLEELFREQYTNNPPTIDDILPKAKKKSEENSIDYILNRTFYRPRDVIDFLNTCVNQEDGGFNFTWSSIYKAEIEYSQRRLNSLVDEWKDSYYGLPVLYSLLKKLEEKFSLEDITNEYVELILTHKDCENCRWLVKLRDGFLTNQITFDEIKEEFINVMYLTGLIGIKKSSQDKIEYSYQRPLNITESALTNISSCIFYIHKMFLRTLHTEGKY